MSWTTNVIAGLLATTAFSGLSAQESGPAETAAQGPGTPAEEPDPLSSPPADVMEFHDADGKPLPPEIQKELREQLLKDPEQLAKAQARTPDDPNEILVSGERGAVVGNIAPERSFSPLDLRAYGASTVEELIEALGPQVASNRGRGDAPPVTLLNGRRVANFAEIARIPSEAIARMDVFPEELALQYGYRADQKVVNVVTRERFDSQFGQLALNAATEGGWSRGSLEVDHFEIRGDTRLGLAASHARSGSLLESERELVQPALPAGDLGRFRTLIPATERTELSGLIARPLGQAISGTISAGLERNSSDSLFGLDGDSPLGRDIDSTALRFGATVDGRIERWNWTLTSNYRRTDTDIATDIAGPGPRDRADSREAVADVDVLLSGTLFELPAGPVLASLRGGVDAQDFGATSRRGGALQRTDLSRESASAQLGLAIPVLGSDKDDEGPLGRLSANVDLGFERLSDIGTLHSLSYGLFWSPIEAINFVASSTLEEGAPTLQQLGAPLIETPNVRVFDFTRREVADVTRISGGNRNLLADDREVTRLGLNVKPLTRKDLFLSIDYVATSIDDPIAPFPIVLPEVEAAFPERFVRASDGSLRRIDGRPINFARSDQKKLRWGVNFTKPLGPVPAGMQQNSARTFTSIEEVKRAFPNAVVIKAEPGSAMARQGQNASSRLFFSVYHDWYLEDEIILRNGVAPLDLLEGGAIDFAGGRRRHELEFQAGAFKRGLGARVDVKWRSGSEVRGLAGAAGDLSFDSIATVNLNLFANLSERIGIDKTPGWLKGARISAGISNLFNARPQVRDANGVIPVSYQPGYLDPLGRTVNVNVRKTF